MRKVVTCLFLVAVLLVFVGGANADLTLFTDRSAFTSQGTIAENYGFEDFPIASSYSTIAPWTTHGVTYTTDGYVHGPHDGGPASNVYVSASTGWNPLTGTVNNNYTMFGFDLGVLNNPSNLNLSITTNLNTYEFNNLVFPVDALAIFRFYGFVAGAGEHFDSFTINAVEGLWRAPAIDNVTLGMAGAVPIPGAVWLLGSGLIGLVGWRRFRKS